jgi:IclR family KDG regulon transcriptional repressor
METVRAVDRALEIMDCFTENRKEIGLSELSRLLDLPKATVLRLARTLENKSYLIQDSESQTYRLGPKVVNLSHVFLSNLDFRMVALPFMKDLRDKSQETVTLYVVSEYKRLCVQRVESNHTLRQAINIGDYLPLDQGSAGKLLIAFHGLLPFFKEVEVKEIEKIISQGYAVSFEEREEGLSSISAPIRNDKGEVIAAMSVSGSAFRFTKDKIEKYVEEVVKTTQEISYQLGYLS